MASLGVGFFTPPVALPLRGRGRSQAATMATKGSMASGAPKEKGLFAWVVGRMQKDEQLLETDPVLQKVEDKTTVSVSVSAKSKAAATPTNNGGFGGLGGLFAKK